VDPVSLFFGAIFAALGLTFLLGRVDLGNVHQMRWIGPAAAIVAGLVVLGLAMTRAEPSRASEPGAEPETAELDSPEEPAD
jgi:hypothetical protein